MRFFKLISYRQFISVASGAIVVLLSGCETLRQSLSPLLSLFPPPISQPSVLSTPGSSTGRSAQSTATANMEAQVRQQINKIRQQQGLTELRDNQKLAAVARQYSRRMAEQNFFSHTSPSGDSAAERVSSAGVFYFVLGENLFTSTNITEPVPAAVEGWMNSPGHRQNILRSEYRETGIGVWRRGSTYYFTQLFMRSF